MTQDDFIHIIDNGDVDRLVKCANDVGKATAPVKSSQIRGIFATARQIQLNWASESDTDGKKAYHEAVLLKPRIGYAASRNSLYGLDDALIGALDRVSQGEDLTKKQERYNRFVDFFEAIVAYHKMNGGRA